MVGIRRVFENDEIIIYRRMRYLRNCCGDKRYFEASKTTGATGRQFRSITQVKKYTEEIAPATKVFKKPWGMTLDEFGSVTEFPTGGRFNISGKAQEIRIKEEGFSQYFTSEKKAREWIDKRYRKEAKNKKGE